MKIIGRLISAIVTLILVFSLIMVACAVLSSRDGGIPNVFGYTLMRIVSGSMEPEFKVNSYILVKPAKPDELRIGDVITFFSSDPEILDLPVTHRITDVTNDESGVRQFITKGDANSLIDPFPVTEERLIGKLCTKISFLEFMNVLTDNPNIFLLVIVVPMVIAVLVFIVRLVIIGSSPDGGDAG